MKRLYLQYLAFLLLLVVSPASFAQEVSSIITESVPVSEKYSVESAKIALENGTAELVAICGTALILNSRKDNLFKEKYGVGIKVFGDMIDGSPQELKRYNYAIFEWLDEKYGKGWIKDVRKEVVGYDRWVLYQDAIPYLLCQTKPIFNGRSSTTTGRSDIDFSFWVIQHMEVEEPYRIPGRVTVRVLLSEEGEILDIDDIGRTPNTYLSAAFIRTMKTAPTWTPGYHNGKPCKVLMTIPAHIDFR
ncbi:MAG: hypothetical protein IJ909_05735 [Fibrobacter sp.]|nr:hypothetical protein [Fibrobacter sp.]